MSNVSGQLKEGAGCIPVRVSKDGKVDVLMIQRNTFDYVWEFPKGKRFEQTAVRELFEETGLHGTLLPLEPLVQEYVRVIEGVDLHNKILLFFCTVPSDSIVQMQKKELVGYEWLPTSALEGRATFQELKTLVQKAKDIIDKHVFFK